MGTTIGTRGSGSGGLGINGSGSEIDATGVTITASNLVSGHHIAAFDRFPAGGDNAELVVRWMGEGFTGGGTAFIDQFDHASPQGDSARRPPAPTDSGVTTVSGGSIGTTGAAAYAVSVNTGGVVTLTGTTIARRGDGSGGLGIQRRRSKSTRRV